MQETTAKLFPSESLVYYQRELTYPSGVIKVHSMRARVCHIAPLGLAIHRLKWTVAIEDGPGNDGAFIEYHITPLPEDPTSFVHGDNLIGHLSGMYVLTLKAPVEECPEVKT